MTLSTTGVTLMRVYLPYPDFRRSAKCLSDEHLREQRNACRSLIQAVTVPGSQGADSTDAATWRDWRNGLLWTTDATLEERRRRGTGERGVTPWMLYDKAGQTPPAWWGDSSYHDQVKRELLHLAPAHYGKMGWFGG